MGIIPAKSQSKFEENIRISFAKVKEELGEHLEAINDNTREMQDVQDQFVHLEQKVDKLSEKIDELLALVGPGKKTFEVQQLSLREQEVFIALYTKNKPLSYSQICQRTGLPVELIKEITMNLTAKGIPLQKRLIEDEVVLEIEPEFKEHQAKTNVLELNEQILKHMC